MQQRKEILEIDCYDVRRELSNYVDSDVSRELRLRIERHLENCHHCTAIYDGLRNIVRLMGDDQAIELPEGFSRRLYHRFLQGL